MDSILFSTVRQKLKTKYEFEGKIGEGGFGVVRKAHEKGNVNKTVAVKQFKFRKIIGREGVYQSVCREITLLRELKHVNIIEVFDVIIDPDLGVNIVEKEDRKIQIVMVFPYCEMDVLQLLSWHRKQKPNVYNNMSNHIERTVICSIMWQLFCGTSYLHKNFVIHRDIKPANLLINTSGGIGCVKICDFGLARIFKEPIRSLGRDGPVVTIWYRSPEILLGSEHYTPAVDVWSIGCVLYELVTSKPLFKGEEVKEKNNQNPFQSFQLKEIFKKLGTPTKDDWFFIDKLKYYERIQKKEFQFPNVFEKHLSLFDNVTKDLLMKCLHFDPNLRATCEEAMRHPFFQQKFSKQNIFQFAQNKQISKLRRSVEPRRDSRPTLKRHRNNNQYSSRKKRKFTK